MWAWTTRSRQSLQARVWRPVQVWCQVHLADSCRSPWRGFASSLSEHGASVSMTTPAVHGLVRRMTTERGLQRSRVAALTLPAARGLAQHLIRGLAIAPGLFDTPSRHGCRRRPTPPSPNRSRTPHTSTTLPSSPPWYGTSPRTPCSVARSSASTGRSVWQLAEGQIGLDSRPTDCVVECQRLVDNDHSQRLSSGPGVRLPDGAVGRANIDKRSARFRSSQ